MSSTSSLPAQITAETMVIHTRRPVWRFVLDSLLTVLAWAAFVYLSLLGFWHISHQTLTGMPSASTWLKIEPTLATLVTYALLMLLYGLTLLSWAQYNRIRFKGKLRRTQLATVQDADLQQHYGVDADTLHQLRTASISVIHHSGDGVITGVRTLAATPAAVPAHATSESLPVK